MFIRFLGLQLPSTLHKRLHQLGSISDQDACSSVSYGGQHFRQQADECIAYVMSMILGKSCSSIDFVGSRAFHWSNEAFVSDGGLCQ
jgi:hypothetical protein